MKKLILILFALSTLGYANAVNVESYNLLQASFTATNEGPVAIPQTLAGSIVLMGVNVSSGSGGGFLKIYNSSGVASNQIANITLGATGYYKFEVLLSSGLTYTTSGNTQGVTFTYKKTRLP